MKNILKDYTDAFVRAKTCKEMAHCLHNIVDIILEYDDNTLQSTLLQAVLETLGAAIRSDIDDQFTQTDAKPWHIATGTEADRIYIVQEIGIVSDIDSSIILAKMDYLAFKLDAADDCSVHNVEHMGQILAYCEREFHCFTKMQNYNRVLAILPDLDIDCVAVCTPWDGETFAMVINAKNSAWDIIETMGYEIVALIIASDGVPVAALDLLTQTGSCDSKVLGEDEQFWEYILGIKAGLAYKGPYGERILSELSNDQNGKLWFGFIKNLEA